ncbi:MAG TPA: serine O-acetyltransferase EpsC [Pirellulales bacterium]|jgi:serine O-acetyltransferase
MSISQRIDGKTEKAAAASPSDLHWDIHAIVDQLRDLRQASLAARNRLDKPAKLPSRAALASIVESVITSLFPNRLASHALDSESVDFFVGHTLDKALRELVGQVVRELQFVAGDEVASEEQRNQAITIVRNFADRLPTIRELLETDIRAAYEGDPAARSVDEVLACYPGVTAIAHYRLANALFELGAVLVARIITEIAHSLTGIDIHPGATINGSFFIDHGTGVVIGETAVIGRHVRLYHGVTLGAKSFQVDEDGTLVKGNARHPTVEDDVVIYANATILGRITIGRGSVIGGNVWLTRSVPAGSNIAQAQVRSEIFVEGSGI